MASGASPSMAYQPLNQPGAGLNDDGEDGERRWKASLDLISIFRLLVAGLAFADIIVWIASGLAGIPTPLNVVFAELFLVVAWNLFLVFPRCGVARVLPVIVCQIGEWTCVLNGDDRPDGRLRKPRTKTQKRTMLVLTAAVDLALGLTIIIIMGKWPSQPRASVSSHTADGSICV